MKRIFTLLIAVVLLASACTTPGTTSPTDPTTQQLSTFNSEEEFKQFFSQSSSSGGFGLFDGGVMMEQRAMAATVDSAESDSSTPSFTSTNVQVQGIDEPDFVKTDGNYIYTISSRTLSILEADSLDILFQDNIEDGFNPQDLLLEGDKLVVLGTRYSNSESRFFTGRQTFALAYDVSDREDPVLDEEIFVEGSFTDARLSQSTIYIISTQYSRSISGPPIIVFDDVASSVAVSDIWRLPHPYSRPQLTTVLAAPLSDLSSFESVAVVTENGAQVYMSESNIFLASSEHINEWDIRQEVTIDVLESALPVDQRDIVDRTRQVDSDILSDDEKKSKILQIIYEYVEQLPQADQEELEEQLESAFEAAMQDYEYLQYTHLSRISVDQENLELVSTGKVPGTINNQFSMDEHDSVLRIATTISPRRDYALDEQIPSESHVYTLDDDFDILDSATGLGKDERIFSTRFMQDRLYLVTFRQVDPFYVVDLADPENIEVLGELKIPGFSRYLHPFDDDTIIGIGRQADLDGRVEGVKVSLFDVSDVANPTEAATYTIKSRYSSSAAEYDHHAFLFEPSSGIMALPINDWGRGDSESFSGVYVFELSSDNIEELGQVSHDNNRFNYQSRIQRSMIIDGDLFTVSNARVQSNTLPDLDRIDSAAILEEKDFDLPIPIEPIAR